MEVVYENRRIIQAHEVDFKNHLRLDSLFMLLQDTAAMHADKVNLGYKDLYIHNLAWVLAWTKLKVMDLPSFSDEIVIKTWPRKKYKLYILRDFYIIKNGETICRATTAWLPINFRTRRIIDASALPTTIYYNEKEPAIDEVPGKIIKPENKAFIFHRQMRYTDIDLNQHVNNIRYIEMIMDSFDKDIYDKSLLKSITINFISESKYGDEIGIYKSVNDSDESVIIEGINKGNEKIVFQAELGWMGSG